MSGVGRSAIAVGGVALLVGAIAGGGWGWHQAKIPPDVEPWRSRATQVATSLQLDPNILLAMIAAESGGDERAVSPAGARGLMQLMLPTAAEQAKHMHEPVPSAEQLLDGGRNLRLGAGYFRRLLDRFDGDLVFAIAAYNAGPTAVRRWARRALDVSSLEVIAREGHAETRAHVRRVLRYRDALASK